MIICPNIFAFATYIWALLSSHTFFCSSSEPCSVTTFALVTPLVYVCWGPIFVFRPTFFSEQNLFQDPTVLESNFFQDGKLFPIHYFHCLPSGLHWTKYCSKSQIKQTQIRFCIDQSILFYIFLLLGAK